MDEQMLADLHVERLAHEIARQRPIYDITSTPHEIARALYRLGWQPPSTKTPDEVCDRAWHDYLEERGWLTKGTQPDTGADFTNGFAAGAEWARREQARAAIRALAEGERE